jgi:hypothetical protein
MLAATSVGIFLIPMLYVFWESLRERAGMMFRRNGNAHAQPVEHA